METLNRRLFVTTAGAGLVLPLLRTNVLAQPADAPVLSHVGREMARLYKQQRSGPFYAEHYASLAANLRLMALVFPDIRALARRKPGRRRDDHAEHLKRADEVRKHFGIDISGEPPMAPLTPDVEAKVRAQLALEGLGPTLLKMADLAEARGRAVAANGNHPQFQRVQTSPYDPWCVYMPVLETTVEITCLPVWAPANPLLYAIVCSVAIITRMVWKWVC